MTDINIKQKINIVGLGAVSTLLILLMIEVVFAQIITSFLIGNISDNLMLLIIITGLFIFTIVIAFIVGYMVTEDISLKEVRNASILSVICLILVLFIMCNIILFIYYGDIYSEIQGFEILWIFPQVLVYFSIYILGNVFNLFIMVIVIYYIFFIIFLEEFHENRSF